VSIYYYQISGFSNAFDKALKSGQNNQSNILLLRFQKQNTPKL
jgi:hypothetical protein